MTNVKRIQANYACTEICTVDSQDFPTKIQFTDHSLTVQAPPNITRSALSNGHKIKKIQNNSQRQLMQASHCNIFLCTEICQNLLRSSGYLPISGCNLLKLRAKNLTKLVLLQAWTIIQDSQGGQPVDTCHSTRHATFCLCTLTINIMSFKSYCRSSC